MIHYNNILPYRNTNNEPEELEQGEFVDTADGMTQMRNQNNDLFNPFFFS